MRIHSNTLTVTDLAEAGKRAGYAVGVRFSWHGSRRRAAAWDVSLTGTSSRRPNNQGAWTEDDSYAATWDEWGMFLAEIFRRDPLAVIPKVYESAEHFRWATCARFDTLEPAGQCSRSGHKWSFSVPVATGSYSVRQCQREECGASERFARSPEALALILSEDA